MAQIISLVNQKGGVGKTTTAVNLAAYLSLPGKRVLLIDIDPQGNASSGVGVDYQRLEKGIYEVLASLLPFRQIIYPTKHKGLEVAPATINLAGANVELVNASQREFRLQETIQEVIDDYDFIIIDCPPSLGLLTINGLVASSEVLIPVQCEYYALEGLGQLLKTINLVQENLKSDLKIMGALMTMYEEKNRLTQAVFRELYKYFPEKIFRTVIPRNVKLAEAPSYGQTVLEYGPRSRGARAYARLAREILNNNPHLIIK